MPSHGLQVLTRAYYFVGGLIVAMAGLATLWAAVSGAIDGCRLVFSQGDIVEPIPGQPIPPGVLDCQQYVSVLNFVLPVLTGIVLFAAAVRFGNTGRRWSVVIAIAAILGIAVSAAPMATIWWISDYYSGTWPDPIGFAIGTLPLLVGFGAAWVTWRVHRGRVVARNPSPA